MINGDLASRSSSATSCVNLGTLSEGSGSQCTPLSAFLLEALSRRPHSLPCGGPSAYRDGASQSPFRSWPDGPAGVPSLQLVWVV